MNAWDFSLDKKAFARILKEELRNKKSNLKQMCKETGISYPTATKWTIGETQPSGIMLLKIAAYLGVSPYSLYGFPVADNSSNLEIQRLQKLNQELTEEKQQKENEIKELQECVSDLYMQNKKLKENCSEIQ